MTQVLINDILPWTQAIAIGGQTVFSTTWTADVASDVVVYQRPANTAANDVTQKLPTSAYNVSFIGGARTVLVTLNTPATLNDVITITRQTPADRLNLYTNTNFVPSMLNNDFGILTLVDQQAQLVNQQIAPRYNYSAFINVPIDTILPILGPNQFWGKNNTNTAIVALNISDVSGGGTVTEIDTGLGLTGGPIINTGTISFAPMNANTFWGNITGSVAVPTQVPTSYFLKSSAIGVTVEAWSPALDSIAGLVTSANQIPYLTAPDTYSMIAAQANSVLASNGASVPAMRTSLPSAVQLNITQLGVQAQDLDMGSHQIHNVLDPSNPQDAATRAYVLAQTTGMFLPLSGGTMSGAIDMGNKQINHMADPTSSQDAVTLSYLNTALALKLSLSGGTMTGQINMGSNKIISLLDPTNPQDAATKNYVDSVATGFTVKQAVQAATTANLNATYLNGASGIGATLTNAGALTALVIDGYTVNTNDRILVKDQSSTLQNGIYVATNVGSGAVAWVLTRATDFDQPAEIQPGDLVIINNGTVNAGTSWIQTATVSAVGTDPILFSQFTFSATSVLLKANNLSDVANTTTAFNNISPLTTKGDLIGFSTQNVRLAVGASNGQILQVNSSAATGLAWSTATYPSTTTINQILFSSASNTVSGITAALGGVLVSDASSIPQFLANPSATGKILQSVNGQIPAWSTPTYPSTSGTAGKMLVSDGTNVVYSTPTFPNASAAAGKFIRSDGTNWIASTPTLPTTAGTARTVLISDGTNFVNTVETYATPGTSGNVMTSDGTNWTSAPAAGVTLLTTKGDLFGFSTVNARVPVASGNGKVLQVDSTASTGLSYSTPTYPSSSASAGLFLVSDGTNFVASAKAAFTTVNIQVFTSTGANTYTPTSGTKYAYVELWGAGGGGSTSNSSTIFGSGGGAGAYSAALVSSPSSVTISIGTGGNGQAANNGTAGTDGGDTTYNSTTIVAKGGSHATNTTTAGNGGAGGSGTGTIKLSGGNGNGNPASGTGFVCQGGSSPRNIPKEALNNFSANGLANSGQGGGAGNNGNAGGNGGSGYAVVTEYIYA